MELPENQLLVMGKNLPSRKHAEAKLLLPI